ncbi:MAG: PAC2 family protein [Nanoarchaeota archaeon]|nr:PAC2 family protein [Nanoarchaeota archaeon]MBU0963370.1 PAC2 family protein [Nanoarchaeota archaeon]
MEYILNQKPKSPIIIQGFPSFGLVGTIATGFLIDHLNAKSIGEIIVKEVSPMIAIHNSTIIKPLEIYYAKKENIIIINALMNVAGIEWDLADTILKMAKDLGAKEIITLEGVASPELTGTPKAYFYSTKSPEKMKKEGVLEMNEGVVLGVTASLLLRNKSQSISCIFTEAHTDLPDSIAAAKAIEVIDKHLGLSVDYKPLLKKAAEFEGKLKDIMSKGKKSMQMAKEKELSYMG